MKHPDWPQRLDAAVEAAKTRAFAYGAQDCCMFAADCILAMTGIDYAAEVRGYTSKDEAYQIVARFGSFEAMLTSLFEREPVHPSQAGRGDVVLASADLAPGETGEFVGVCLGPKLAVPKIEGGLRFLPRSVARIAWRIS